MSTTTISTSLEQVEYQNLLQISWVQSKLAKNFKTIVDFIKQTKNNSDGMYAKTQRDLADLRNKESAKGDFEQRLKALQRNHAQSQAKNNQILQLHRQQIQKLKELKNIEPIVKVSAPKAESVPKTESAPLPDQLMHEKHFKDLQDRLNKVQAKTKENSFRIKDQSQRLKINFQEHQHLAKSFDQKLHKQIQKIAPQLLNLLEKAKSLSDIQAKLEKIQKLADEQSDNKLISFIEQIEKLKARVSELQQVKPQDTNVDTNQINQKILGLQSLIQTLNSKLADFESKTNDQEMSLLKERITYLEQLGSNQLASTTTGPSTTASTTSSDSAAHARMIERINKISLQLHSYVTKQQHQKDVLALRDRIQKTDKAQVKQSQLNTKRNDEIWAYLKALVIPEPFDYNQKLAQINQDINLKNQIVNKKQDQLSNKNDTLRKELVLLKEEVQKLKTQSPASHVKAPSQKEDSIYKDTTILSKKTASDLQDLRKEFDNQLHDLKIQFISTLKDMEKRIDAIKSLEHDLNNVLNKFDQLRASLNKKADLADTKKGLQFLENKIYAVCSTLSKEETSHDDARVARKNWFCLSCDKMLTNYTGKTGKTIVWDALPSRKLVLSKKEQLPSLK